MKILGIESSCDETAAAVIENGERLLSNVVNTQINIHAEYGGVIPEIAARSHLEVIHPVVHKALHDAGCTWDDIDAIAVTYAPGLIGSLLVGTLAARTLAIVHQKPLYKIHHVEAHVYANFITKQRSATSSFATHPLPQAGSPQTDAIEENTAIDTAEPTSPSSLTEGSVFPTERTQDDGSLRVRVSEGGDDGEVVREEVIKGANKDSENKLPLPQTQPSFPLLALIVSGGHSQLVFFRNHGDYDLIGQTQDDAVGEAFDKVAKILGLPYPGGPSISKAATFGDPTSFTLPIARLKCTHSGTHTGMERKAQPSSEQSRTTLYGDGATQVATQRSAQEVCHYYDFSFSGLKTAVLRAVQAEVGKDYSFPSHELPGLVDDDLRHNMAASFQYTAVKTLVSKTTLAYEVYQPASVVIAGGVAANLELRRQLSAALPIDIEYAPIQLCTDNAAMIATLAYYRSQIDEPADPFDMEVEPSLSMLSLLQ